MTRHVVVVGGQHGGAWIAARIKKNFRGGAHVTFVSPVSERPVLPLLVRSLATDAEYPRVHYQEELSHLHVHVITSDVVAHDAANKKLYLDHGILSYDVLVVDPLVVPQSTVPGAIDYAYSVHDAKSAHALTKHVDTILAASTSMPDDERDAAQRVLVVGDDVQAVELAIAVRRRAKTLHGIDAEVVLVGELPDVSRLLSVLDHHRIVYHAARPKRILSRSVACDDGLVFDALTIISSGEWVRKDGLEHGVGVHVLPVTTPYWPLSGVSAARHATHWVSSFLSGKPAPPPPRIIPALSRLAADDRLRVRGPLRRLRHRWQLHRYLSL